MFKIENEVLEWGGKTLTLETGRVARQAHGSVIATSVSYTHLTLPTKA